MSVVISTNTSASIAANNLAASNEMLRKSLNRLSSGSKIVTAADDAAGVAVAARLTAASRRAVAANTGIGNAVSFLQNQDSLLKEMTKIATRMNELEMMYKDSVVDTQKDLYKKEFDSLKNDFNSLADTKFNGLALLDGAAGLDVIVDEAGTKKTLAAITSPTLDDIDKDSTGDALDDLSAARAENGANQSSLGFYAALGAATVSNYDSAISRIVDVDVAVESTQLARWTTMVQAGTAMLAQANGSTVSAISLLKG